MAIKGIDNLNSDKRICIADALIIVLAYAAQRISEFFIAPTKTAVLLMAMIHVALLAFVVLTLMKTNEPFFGLLTATLGYKMMPVSISALVTQTVDGDILYYLVRKAAALVFIVLIYKIYSQQKNDETHIRLMTVFAVLFAVPFFNEIGNALMDYFISRTGSMLFGYFSQLGAYAAATLIILAIAYISGYKSMRFAALFEFGALSINAMKFAARIIVRIVNNSHISKSYYIWLALCVVLIVCFAVALVLKRREEASAA